MFIKQNRKEKYTSKSIKSVNIFFILTSIIDILEKRAMHIDQTDNQLIKLLEENSKYGLKELAERVGLTATPVHERIKRLERNGVIEKYTIKVNPEKTGHGLTILCNVQLKSHNAMILEEFESEIVKIKEVVSCYHIAGNYDYLLTLQMKDMDEYGNFVKGKLASIPHIAQVQSSFVMRKIKEK